MIDSVYILDNASAALILQHSFTGRPAPSTILEFFQALVLDDPLSSPPSILPVPVNLLSPPSALFSTKSSNNNLIILSLVKKEPRDATGVIELLDRIIEVLESYFDKDKLGRGVIEGNFDIVEEILGEMVDNGEIMTTEPSALRDIILPPSLLNKLMSAAGLQG
jgi:AP-3 complex subunit mu